MPNGHKYTRTHKRDEGHNARTHTHTHEGHTGCGWYERDHFFTFYITHTLNRSAYLLSVQHNEHSMSAINFSIPAPTNGLMIDHRNPPTTHIFNDVAIDGTIHKVVYICGDQMVYQPTPLPSQKNDNDIFYLSSDEDGIEGLDLLPPISSPKKKKGAKAQFQARKDARKLKKEAAVKLIQAVFVGIRTREEAKHAQEKYAAELKKERAARKALRKSPAGKAQKTAQKMADEYNKVQAESCPSPQDS